MKKAETTEQEHDICHQYLERKMKLSPDWLSEDPKIQIKAEKFFEIAKRDKVTLQAWCEKWLTKEQQKQLKAAIRAKRSRSKRKRGEGTKSVTLSHQAWLILSDCAKRDKVTLSELIINRLEAEWLSSPEAP